MIEVAKIVLHEADEPDFVANLLNADFWARKSPISKFGYKKLRDIKAV